MVGLISPLNLWITNNLKKNYIKPYSTQEGANLVPPAVFPLFEAWFFIWI